MLYKSKYTFEISFTNDFSLYISNHKQTYLNISTGDLFVSSVNTIIPTEIKESHNSYVVSKYYEPWISVDNEIFDKMFHMIANLIEEVLKNDGKKSLSIKGFLIEEQNKRLVREIKMSMEIENILIR